MSNINIYSELLSKFPYNNIEILAYISYIDHCNKTNKFLPDKFYTEEHHILPKKTFPEYENLKKNFWNCINLTFFQHIVAHAKMAKFKSYDMQWAYVCMMSRIPKLLGEFPLLNLHNKNLRKGLNNPKVDKTLYRFQNMVTKEIVGPTTKHEFMKSIGKIYLMPEFCDLTKLKSSFGWICYDATNPERADQILRNQVGENNPLADKNLYQFQRISDGFVTEKLSRMTFCEKYGVKKTLISKLFSNKNGLTVFGWCLYDKENPNRLEEILKIKQYKRQKDKTKYRFINVDCGFVTNPLTQSEFSNFINVNPRRVSTLKSYREENRTVNGWIFYNDEIPYRWIEFQKSRRKSPSFGWMEIVYGQTIATN